MDRINIVISLMSMTVGLFLSYVRGRRNHRLGKPPGSSSSSGSYRQHVHRWRIPYRGQTEPDYCVRQRNDL